MIVSQQQKDGRQLSNFSLSPYLILWELTRACTLACKHCRARAIRRRSSGELGLEEICTVLSDLEQEAQRPLLVLTGGDPTERSDLFDIIDEARKRNFKVAITPSATLTMSRDLVGKLKEHGVERLAISLDGPDVETQDFFRQVRGSFEITINIIRWANECELPIQINTTVTRYNRDKFNKIGELVARSNVVLWSLFFLVPTGRANNQMQITAAEAESVMGKMVELACSGSVKATAAPHFRRVLIQKLHGNGESADLNPKLRLGALRSYQSINDGKGIVFISHTGDVFPSGFLPLAGGNVREQSLLDIPFGYLP